MTRTEDRLTDALAARAAGVAAGSIRPLPTRDAGRSDGRSTSRRWSASLVPLAAAASLAGIAGVVATMPHHHGPASTPPGLPRHSALLGIAAAAADDIWAVGVIPAVRRVLPLVMHWNGKAWARSHIRPASRFDYLWAVDAVSATDVWAAGSASTGIKTSQPYIVRWNGAAWRRMPTPELPAPAELRGIAVVSAREAWAVGSAAGALILHWNGTRWHDMPNPGSTGGGRLYSIFAKSAHDVWAVGTARSGSLILHWDGVAWHRLGGPGGARYGVNIAGVTEVSPRLAWLVGNRRDGLALILRWNGRTLQQVPRPKALVGGGLSGVAAVAARQAWAVGACLVHRYGGHRHGVRTAILRWRGQSWQRVPDPAGRVPGNLVGIVAPSARSAWAIGYTGLRIGFASRAIILHWNGSAWQVVAPPSRSGDSFPPRASR
jgi:hypothetical protein